MVFWAAHLLSVVLLLQRACMAGWLTKRAIAQTKLHSSRAMATTILLRISFLAASLRNRAHRRTCAAHAMSVTSLGNSEVLRAMPRVTRAGWS